MLVVLKINHHKIIQLHIQRIFINQKNMMSIQTEYMIMFTENVQI